MIRHKESDGMDGGRPVGRKLTRREFLLAGAGAGAGLFAWGLRRPSAG